METVPLRPMTTGELLDRTFTVFRGNFWLFVGIMLFPQIFMLAGQLLGTFAPVRQRVAVPAVASLGIVVALLLMVGLVASLLAHAASIFVVSEYQLGRTTSVGEAYRKARGRLWPVIFSGFIFGLAIAGGMLLLVIPGIWVMLRGALVIQTATLEEIKGVAALRRSFALTKGSAGQISLVWVFTFVIMIVAIALFQLPATLLLPAPWSTRFASLGGVLASVLAGPLGTIALSLVYFDRRVRKEALDLEVMMATIDQAGSVPPAVPS